MTMALPNRWTLKKLGQIADISAGGNAPQGDNYFEGGTHPFVRVKHFDGANTYVQQWDLITDKAIKDYRLKAFPKGTIVFPKSGASIRLEKRAIISVSAFLVGHLCAIQPFADKACPLFIFYLLKKIKFAQDSNGTTLPFLNLKAIADSQLMCPPLPEQKKIAAVLSKLQKAIEVQDNILGSLRDLKKSMMHRLFSYGLKGEKRKKTEISLIPEGWEVKTFETIIQQGQYGLSVRGKEDGQYPILRMNCQKDGYVVWNNLQYIDIDENTWMKFKIKNGDLLFNRTNSIDLVGRMAIYDSDKDAVIASYLIRLTLKQDVALPRFFNYYFNMESTQTALKGLATRGVSQSNISLSKLKTFRIPIAPLREQTEIAHILQTIDHKIEIHEGKKSGQQDLFKTMLNNLMTGTIRVNELDIDTAEVEAA